MLTKKAQAEVKKAKEILACENRIRVMTRNILDVYKRSTDEERAHGMQWYRVARTLITETATKYGIEPRLAISVCAVLSPNNSWTGNLRDLAKVLDTFSNFPRAFKTMVKAFDAPETGYKPRGNTDAFKALRCATYPMMILKAYRVLRERSAQSLFGKHCPKTWAFDDCIANDETDSVCVDFHAYNVANGTEFKSKETPACVGKLYQEISEAYRNAARVVGIEPKQMQAVTWVVRRNNLDRADIERSESNALAKVRSNRMQRERDLYVAL